MKGASGDVSYMDVGRRLTLIVLCMYDKNNHMATVCLCRGSVIARIISMDGPRNNPLKEIGKAAGCPDTPYSDTGRWTDPQYPVDVTLTRPVLISNRHSIVIPADFGGTYISAPL